MSSCSSIKTNILTIKGKRRYFHIMNIAYDMFIEKGYNAVNMEDVVRKSGGSLSTLYKYFGTKEHLLICTLNNKNEELLTFWHNLQIKDNISFEEYLYFIGKKFLDFLIDYNAILLYRFILSLQFSINSRLYYKLVEDIIIAYPNKLISDYLTQKNIKQYRKIKDSLIYAQQFLHALQAPLIYKQILEINNFEKREKFKQNILEQTIFVFVSSY